MFHLDGAQQLPSMLETWEGYTPYSYSSSRPCGTGWPEASGTHDVNEIWPTNCRCRLAMKPYQDRKECRTWSDQGVACGKIRFFFLPFFVPLAASRLVETPAMLVIGGPDSFVELQTHHAMDADYTAYMLRTSYGAVVL